ncbi:MAG: flagellar hook-associated protein FlgK [Clostridiales bacterium]|jgi:flagellar hook-associated protein FlgK|nr:flagellar hook-associated protein FlgK [Clostridiales bacterium]
MGMSSLGIAVSGLNAAQAGLYVTAHNTSNNNTVGYVRQQVMQNDFFSKAVGYNAIGTMQLGLGTDVSAIRQLRDTFLDVNYRASLSKMSFYSAKAATGSEIEVVIGELQSDYKAQDVIMDIWDALSELSKDLGSIETRENFVNTCISFINKVNNVSERLVDYQQNLDLQIRDAVTRVNQLVTQIDTLNNLIVNVEISGDHANDYRDERNLCMDELSSLLDINYKEAPNGRMDITTGGYELLVNGNANRLGLRYTTKGYSFVEPVFTNATEILDWDSPAASYKPLYKPNQLISSQIGNDRGLLLGLLAARGYAPANYATGAGTEPTAPTAPAPPAMLYQMPDPSDPMYTGNINLDPDYLADFADYVQAYDAYARLYYLAPSIAVPPLPPDIDDPAYTHGGVDMGYRTALSTYVINRTTYVTTDLPSYQANLTVYLADLNEYQIAYNQYQKQLFDIQQAMIPRAQKEFDTLVHHIVTMINDKFSPYTQATPPVFDTANAPLDQDGNQQRMDIFARKYEPYDQRFDSADNLIPEDTDNVYSLYTMGNLVINPILSNSDGYAKLALSPSGDVDDNRLIIDIMEEWKSTAIYIEYVDKDGFKVSEWVSVDKAYQHFVNHNATANDEAKSYVAAEDVIVRDLDNKRMQISGVALDEEMSNMMIYQHAYNASARVVNEIDSMLDRIINRTGRAGL